MGRPKKYTKEVIDGYGNELLEWFKKPESIWLKDFCIEKGFCSQYLSEFSKESKEFSESLKKAKDIQESRLVHKGLDGKAPAFVIFALKNVAGWRDSMEVKLPEVDEVRFVD